MASDQRRIRVDFHVPNVDRNTFSDAHYMCISGIHVDPEHDTCTVPKVEPILLDTLRIVMACIESMHVALLSRANQDG